MHDPKKQEDLEQHEVKEVLRFLQRYGKLIGIAAAAAVLGLGIGHWRDHRTQTRQADAEALLRVAETPEDLLEVATRYKSTPAGPVALLDLAKTLFNQGEIADARAYYEQFLSSHRRHELRPVAELGLAHCTEAEGDPVHAATQFRQISEHLGEAHHLYPIAILGLSRTLKQAGQVAEARNVLTAFLGEFDQSVWRNAAETALMQLP